MRYRLLCPWGKKTLTFSLNSTRLIRTPHYYGQFAFSLGKENSYTRLIRTPYYYGQFALSLGKKALTFSLNSTSLIRTPLLTGTLSMALSMSLLTGFDCILFVPALGVTSMQYSHRNSLRASFPFGGCSEKLRASGTQEEMRFLAWVASLALEMESFLAV